MTQYSEAQARIADLGGAGTWVRVQFPGTVVEGVLTGRVADWSLIEIEAGGTKFGAGPQHEIERQPDGATVDRVTRRDGRPFTSIRPAEIEPGRYIVVPAPGYYRDRTRVLSSHDVLRDALAAASHGGLAVYTGQERAGDEWLRVYEQGRHRFHTDDTEGCE